MVTLKYALDELKKCKTLNSHFSYSEDSDNSENYAYFVRKCMYENYTYFVTRRYYSSSPIFNSDGREICEPRFLGYTEGLIDFDGNVILKPIYDKIISFNGKNCIAHDGNKFYLFSKEGKELASGVEIMKLTSQPKDIYLIAVTSPMLIDEDGNLIDKQE